MAFGKETSPDVGVKFGEGQDPTKGGRPKKYKALFNECINDDERRQMIEALKDKAIKGDIKAFEVIMDRTDGKPVQDMNIAGLPVMIMQDVRNQDEEE